MTDWQLNLSMQRRLFLLRSNTIDTVLTDLGNKSVSNVALFGVEHQGKYHQHVGFGLKVCPTDVLVAQTLGCFIDDRPGDHSCTCKCK